MVQTEQKIFSRVLFQISLWEWVLGFGLPLLSIFYFAVPQHTLNWSMADERL